MSTLKDSVMIFRFKGPSLLHIGFSLKKFAGPQ